MRLSGRKVLITGASEGVGAATARILAREGASLCLAARRREPLEAMAAELGGRACVVTADVARVEDCERLIEDAARALGGLEVLINNAGAHHRGRVGERSVAELASMVDVNTRAPIVLSRAALPHLVASRGTIVNVASLAGMLPLPDAAAYSATKFALRAFSIALRHELEAQGVRVCLVSPGPIRDTRFLMDALDDASDVTLSQPMSTSAEIAELILASVLDGRQERATPRASAWLAKATYVVPAIRSVLGPMMEARGRRMRLRYLAEREKKAREEKDRDER